MINTLINRVVLFTQTICVDFDEIVARNEALSCFGECPHLCTDMSKKSKDRLRDPALKVTMRDHATYPLTFLTYLYINYRSDNWSDRIRM